MAAIDGSKIVNASQDERSRSDGFQDIGNAVFYLANEFVYFTLDVFVASSTLAVEDARSAARMTGRLSMKLKIFLKIFDKNNVLDRAGNVAKKNFANGSASGLIKLDVFLGESEDEEFAVGGEEGKKRFEIVVETELDVFFKGKREAKEMLMVFVDKDSQAKGLVLPEDFVIDFGSSVGKGFGEGFRSGAGVLELILGLFD